MTPLANARMYAVTPEAESAWVDLLEHIADDAGVALRYEPHPAPLPLDALWRRPDLGAGFMCGFPIAFGMADVVPLAAPVPDAPWAGGRAVYRSDFIVRADSLARNLEDTFGGTIGWTVEHSHSGFNAPRHHLLAFLPVHGGRLYRGSLGDLVTPRGVLDAVLEGRIDVGPLDAYWHLLLRRHRPDLAEGVRVVASTELAPPPAIVAARGRPPVEVAALGRAFVAAAGRPWFPPLAGALCLGGFERVARDGYATMVRWAAEAGGARYPAPA